ncbi:MAG: 3-methyl-2-oxobutanoate hydroxymethyltransferase [Alphaproteobacteria bacterium]|nr:MAG: 3-methyl-2-oxobutanoate hydroxymethyltransferase [Alphaproteobacteria bacterium]
MSTSHSQSRATVRSIASLRGKRPIVALTAYTTPMAKILDEHADILLVGDSLGMVLYGMESTLSVTLDDMIRHTQAVMRGSHKALIITDMPFGTYQASPEQAYHNAARVMKESGAHAVKLEGGVEMAETIAFLTQRGVPVMAHIGLMPQHVHTMGGYRYQGRNATEAQRIAADARAVEEAGAWAILIEGTEAALSEAITQNAAVPTIGIGAGVACDGQILVTEDMVGLNPNPPSFVQKFADLHGQMHHAAASYARAVHERAFPTSTHGYVSKK